jgi:hypothetical protein
MAPWSRRDGGVSSLVARQLQAGIVQVTGNGYAFAAMKEDGSVVTWGEQGCGCDSSLVGRQLQADIVAVGC